jgi:threonine/homoserine/homoserine lactone efflux protein
MMIGHGLLELVAIVLLITGLIKFARSATARGLIGLVGGGVLVYLGYETALIPAEAVTPALQTASGVSVAGGWLGLVWLGALMSMVNPYWWLWWATIGAAHTAWAVQRGRIGAGTYFAGHVSSDVLWYTAVSIALGAGRALLSASTLKLVYVICAAFLTALGAIFAVAAVRTLAGKARPPRQEGTA